MTVCLEDRSPVRPVPPPQSFAQGDCRARLFRRGSDRYAKVSYPQQYGIYSEIETATTIMRFNLRGEIVFLQGKGADWPHPQEWLKRTIGNDWIYYSTGGYAGVVEAIGEYYLPNTPYPTNSLLGGRPFELAAVARLTSSWPEILNEAAASLHQAAPECIRAFLDKALAITPKILQARAEELFRINGGRVTVLPPDARHVDYTVIPAHITEGCLYHCRFCRVKSARPYRLKGRQEVEDLLGQLRQWFDGDLVNYNSLFLGEHDALAAGEAEIVHVIERVSTVLGLGNSVMAGTNVFLFGSVDSLLATSARLFEALNRSSCTVYINVGLESVDQESLDLLGKPLAAARVIEAFRRIREINSAYANIEVTANFIMDGLAPGHMPSLARLLGDDNPRMRGKGCIYLSPLAVGSPSRAAVMDFYRLKSLSRLPTFLYIIQRL